MRFRKLRIAFSATCVIACVLLIVLWVRSYREDISGLVSSRSIFGAISVVAERLVSMPMECDQIPYRRQNVLLLERQMHRIPLDM